MLFIMNIHSNLRDFIYPESNLPFSVNETFMKF